MWVIRLPVFSGKGAVSKIISDVSEQVTRQRGEKKGLKKISINRKQNQKNNYDKQKTISQTINPSRINLAFHTVQ
jgi:hypothetical protein